MRVMALISTMVCALLIGCTDEVYPGSDIEDSYTSRTAGVSYVCVGMEYSSRFGACPGCKYDSDRMNNLFKNVLGYNGVLLQSESATRRSVASAIKNAVEATPYDGLFIFYYSGHGGQEVLNRNTQEPDGADEADEYLCLYDSYLLDDEIWQLISTCKGRVFLCFDACHSQTMFRSVSLDIALEEGYAIPLDSSFIPSKCGFELKPRGIALDAFGPRMLCWSGCLEAEFSFGSAKGGVMTNSILSRWTNGITYDRLWEQVVVDVNTKQPGQHPAATKYGTGFIEAFK